MNYSTIDITKTEYTENNVTQTSMNLIVPGLTTTGEESRETTYGPGPELDAFPD